jgi:proteasome assembly chaperone (PAC2) family protein
MQDVIWNGRPTLRKPVMVCAFNGWNDAGEAASAAVSFIRGSFDAEEVASIDPEEFFDFTAVRPTVRLTEGVTREIDWPVATISAAAVPGAEGDLVMLQATEPSLRWRRYTDNLVATARELNVRMVITLGALLADVPHTRPVAITGLASERSLVDRLGFQHTSYEGPTGIVGVLHDACRAGGLRSASLWAPVPHYVATPPNPPATRALLERFAQLAELPLDLHGLDQLVDLWRVQVDHAIRDNDEVTDYVRELEGRVDAEDASERGIVLGGHPAGGGAVPNADDLAAEVERFLREQDGDT